MKISVITACYNSEQTIGDCLDSVQSQTHRDREHLIIDGASTDLTLSIVESKADENTRVISEPDAGIYDALNKGLSHCRGEVVGFLNADDFFEDNSVLSQVSTALEPEDVEACYADLLYVSPDDTKRIVRTWKSSRFRAGSFKSGWMPPHPTFYARKSVYERIGNFDTSLRIGADWDLLLRFLELERVKSVHVPKVWVRMRLGGASNQFKNVLSNNWQTWRRSCHYFGFVPSLMFPPRKWIHRLKQFK